LEDLGAENWNLYSAENNSTPSPVTWYEVSSGEVTAATGPDGQALADEEGETARDNMELTWDYFFNTHGWDGHDDNGGTCSITVHVGSGWKNASCNAACDCRFGDGGGGWGSFLDVLAHEYGHAVVGQSAGLNYTYLSGAVNEHYADFFAAMIEPSDWLISYPIGFRDLSDPPNGSNESPDHYDELLTVSVPASGNDYGYVHFNSGIPNKASFMVADTGTVAVMMKSSVHCPGSAAHPRRVRPEKQRQKIPRLS
jgi:Zn-dependent metalloprotease